MKDNQAVLRHAQHVQLENPKTLWVPVCVLIVWQDSLCRLRERLNVTCVPIQSLSGELFAQRVVFTPLVDWVRIHWSVIAIAGISSKIQNAWNVQPANTKRESTTEHVTIVPWGNIAQLRLRPAVNYAHHVHLLQDTRRISVVIAF